MYFKYSLTHVRGPPSPHLLLTTHLTRYTRNNLTLRGNIHVAIAVASRLEITTVPLGATKADAYPCNLDGMGWQPKRFFAIEDALAYRGFELERSNGSSTGGIVFASHSPITAPAEPSPSRDAPEFSVTAEESGTHAENSSSPETVTLHDQIWSIKDVEQPLHGSGHAISWEVMGTFGEVILERFSAETLQPIEFLMMAFPLRHLTNMVFWTTESRKITNMPRHHLERS